MFCVWCSKSMQVLGRVRKAKRKIVSQRIFVRPFPPPPRVWPIYVFSECWCHSLSKGYCMSGLLTSFKWAWNIPVSINDSMVPSSNGNCHRVSSLPDDWGHSPPILDPLRQQLECSWPIKITWGKTSLCGLMVLWILKTILGWTAESGLWRKACSPEYLFKKKNLLTYLLVRLL